VNRVLRQLGAIPLLALGVALVAYVLIDALPGDPARVVAGAGADAASVQAVREQLGLDKPAPQRLLEYLGGLLQGDLGTSFQTGRPILAELLEVFPKTLQLALVAEVIALAAGLLIGTLAALRGGRFASNSLMTGSAVAVSLPMFALALMLQLVFAQWLGWLPPSGSGGMFSAAIVLPAITCAIPSAGFVARFARASIAGHLNDEHVRTAVAKGVRPGTVARRHVLRVSYGPLISVAAADLSRLLGGVAIVEVIFSWPGAGKYAYDALVHRDLPALQGALLAITIVVLLTNQFAEIAYRLVDPRIGAHDV
jgi:peptide/nickel transport system permease protein